MGLQATRALRDGCYDIIADAEKYGPPESLAFWRSMESDLQEIAGRPPLLWGGEN